MRLLGKSYRCKDRIRHRNQYNSKQWVDTAAPTMVRKMAPSSSQGSRRIFGSFLDCVFSITYDTWWFRPSWRRL